MDLPLTITFRDMDHSDAIETYVRRRAEKLAPFADKITTCQVVIEVPHRHKQSGRQYRVRIDVMVPGTELVVSHAADEDPSHQDAYAAIDHAFDQMTRRVEDYVRRRRERSTTRTRAAG